jgi:hypothetical protein
LDLTCFVGLVIPSTYKSCQKHEEEVNVITFFRGMQIGDVVETNDICNLAVFRCLLVYGKPKSF